MNEDTLVRASAVMQKQWHKIDGKATVADALTILREKGAEALIVSKRNENDEYGIVLLSDIAKKVLAVDRAPERVNIFEIMSKPVISIHSTMDIRYCARLFERFGLHFAPVTENGEVVGMISYKEMVLKGIATD